MNNERTARWLTRTAITCLCAVLVFSYILPRLANRGRRDPNSRFERAQLENFAAASVQYFAIYNYWPTNIANLYSNANTQHLRLMNGPTNDLWGNPIIYKPFDDKRGFGVVASLGRDGKVGGSGNDQDIEVRFPPEDTRK